MAIDRLAKVELRRSPCYREDPITEDRLPRAELLAKAGAGDFLRCVAEAVVQLLMEIDVEGVIGDARHEQSGDRTIYRNGYRDRKLDTQAGQPAAAHTEAAAGFPSFLEPLSGNRAEQRAAGAPRVSPARRHAGIHQDRSTGTVE